MTIVRKDNTVIHSLADLKGKRIGCLLYTSPHIAAISAAPIEFGIILHRFYDKIKLSFIINR